MRLFISSISLLLTLFSFELKAQIQIEKSVYFDSNSSNLDANALEKLTADFSEFVSRNELEKIIIIGHTDHVGSEDYNMKLSEKRAKAVKSELMALGVSSSIIEYSYKGEKALINSSSDENGKAKNRRVELLYFGKQKMNSTEEDLSAKPEAEKTDTTFVFPKGTELTFEKTAFAPYTIEEVDIEMVEALNLGDIIQMNLQTRDVNGNCLQSGGMIFTSAKVNGDQLAPNSSVTIRIPAKRYNPDFELYDMQVVGGDTLWAPMNIKPELSDDGYYSFTLDSMPNINLDSLMKPLETIAILTPNKAIKDNGVVVKTRGKQIKRTQLFGDDEIHNLAGEQFKKRRSEFDPCYLSPEDYFFVTAIKRGELYYGLQPITNVKYKRLFNRYVFRKKHMQKSNEKEIKRLLEEFELS